MVAHAPHGGVLVGVHVQQGVPGAGLHQLHDVGAHLPVGVGRGGVQLLDVGTGLGLGRHGLPGGEYYQYYGPATVLCTLDYPGTQCGQFVMNI